MKSIQFFAIGRKHGPRYNRRTILIPQNYGRRRMNAPRGWRWHASPRDLFRYRRVGRAQWFGARAVAL